MTYKIMKKGEKIFFCVKMGAKIELPMPFLPRINTSYGKNLKKYFSGAKSASQKWAEKGAQTKFSTFFSPDSFSALIFRKSQEF